MLVLTGVIGLLIAGFALVGLGDSLGTHAGDEGTDDSNASADRDTSARQQDTDLPDLLAQAWNDSQGDGMILTGQSGDEILAGGDGHDLIHGGAGDDQIGGRDGDDTLFGGAGRDDMHGAEGHDSLSGGADADTLYGGSGNDILLGDDGADLLFGQSGDDTLYSGEGDDSLQGGPGNDILFGGAGDDALHGGLGDDTLVAGTGADTLFGGVGNDLLLGNLVKGDGPSDPSYLNGAQGDDTIVAGSGDIISGGPDTDLFTLGHWITDPVQIMDFNSAEDRLLVVYDNNITNDPLIELRVGETANDRMNLYLDGAHIASFSGTDAPHLSDIVLMAQSDLAGLTWGGYLPR